MVAKDQDGEQPNKKTVVIVKHSMIKEVCLWGLFCCGCFLGFFLNNIAVLMTTS